MVHFAKNMNDIVHGLNSMFEDENIMIEPGMRYGNPSIESALEKV